MIINRKEIQNKKKITFPVNIWTEEYLGFLKNNYLA